MDIYNRFYTEFGKAGVKKVLDGFGTEYDHFGQVWGNHREVVLRRMKNALNHKTSVDNHRMVTSKDEERIERVWIAANGREYPISRMKDDHLHNTILLIDRRVRNGEWRVGQNEDLMELVSMMDEERQRRKLPLPLIPIKSLNYRKGEIK
jgi:hypothetical protein